MWLKMCSWSKTALMEFSLEKGAFMYTLIAATLILVTLGVSLMSKERLEHFYTLRCQPPSANL